MGFLDMFDDPDILGKLLGTSGAQAATPPTPPPQPPPPPPQPGPGGNPPSSYFLGGGYGVGGANVDPLNPGQMLGANRPNQPNQPYQGAPNMGQVAPGGFPAVPPSAGTGSDDAASGGAGPGGAPSGAPVQGPAPPSAPSAPNNAILPPNPTATMGGPMLPPMPPRAAMDPAAAPATQSSGGGLAAALGLDPNRLRSGLAGVGRGMTAVSQMRPGTFGGANFAAGMGGAIQGSQAEDVRQEAAERQRKTDLFNQSSTAFKDVLASQESGDKRALNAAHAQYFAARATEMAAGGNTAGTKAWQNTPYGKVIQVENEAQKFEKGQQIILQKRWALNGSTAEQQQADLDRLQKNVDAYRDKLYKQAGVDPKQADKLKSMGTSQDNPFDTKGMTIDQFHSQVPMGAWFKDQNGVARQRTVPPPGSETQPSAAAPQTKAMDDQLAMEPAA